MTAPSLCAVWPSLSTWTAPRCALLQCCIGSFTYTCWCTYSCRSQTQAGPPSCWDCTERSGPSWGAANSSSCSLSSPRRANGQPPTRGSLNMEAWLVTARCAGECAATKLELTLASGQADLLLVAAQSPLDLGSYCFSCHPHWTGRLQVLLLQDTPAQEVRHGDSRLPGPPGCQGLRCTSMSSSWATLTTSPSTSRWFPLTASSLCSSQVDSTNVLEASAQMLTEAWAIV